MVFFRTRCMQTTRSRPRRREASTQTWLDSVRKPADSALTSALLCLAAVLPFGDA